MLPTLSLVGDYNEAADEPHPTKTSISLTLIADGQPLDSSTGLVLCGSFFP
jgi:hypothetical protein